MNMQVSPPPPSQGKLPIDNYSQQYLALPISGSRLNTIGTLQVLVHIVTANC